MAVPAFPWENELQIARWKPDASVRFLMSYKIEIREKEAQPVISVRAVVGTGELIQFFDAACGEMEAYLAKLGVASTGPAMSLWHSQPGEIPSAFDIETCLPLERAVLPSGRMQSRTLPAGMEVFTVHEGAYDDMSLAFDAVWNWLMSEGYELAGPPRDVVLVGPNHTKEPSSYRTEVVYPVSRRK